MAKVKIEYDFEDGSKGELNSIVSDGILNNILIAAQHKRFVVKNHWSRLLSYHKGRYDYNPSFAKALVYRRIQYAKNYQHRITN